MLLGAGRRRGRTVAGAAVFILVVGAYLALSGYMALALTRPYRQPIRHVPEQFDLAYESVSFPSRIDGMTLKGWLLPGAEGRLSRRAVVVVHGWNRDRQSEAEGHILEIAARLVQQGRPVLLFDLRGWGQSEGERFTMGAQEVRDIAGAVDFLDDRGLAGAGVDLLGYSMGAASSLLEAPTDPRVRDIAEDSGYAVLVDVLDTELPKVSGLPSFFTPGTLLMAQPLAGFNPYSIRPVDAMAMLATQRTPLLVIHGEADRLVPASHGRRIADAYGPRAETLFVPGAGHVGSYSIDPTTYLARLTAFFDGAE